MGNQLVGITGLLFVSALLVAYAMALGSKQHRVSSVSQSMTQATNLQSGVPVIGNRILAVRYGNDDTLEADANYYYFTHDTGGDICAWKFKMPSQTSEKQLIEVFAKEDLFLGWLEAKGAKTTVTQWW